MNTSGDKVSIGSLFDEAPPSPMSAGGQKVSIGSLFEEEPAPAKSVFQFGKSSHTPPPPLAAIPKVKPAPPPPPPPPHQSGPGALICPVCQRNLPWVSSEHQLNLHIDECLTKQMLETEATSSPPHPPAPAAKNNPPPSRPGRKILTDSDLARQLAAELAEEDSEEQERQAAMFAASAKISPHPSPAPGASPFAIRCPYPGCGFPQMEAFQFPQHVASFHTAAVSHAYVCPICALDPAFSSFVPDAKTNLMNHLQRVHADLQNVPGAVPGVRQAPPPYHPPHNPPITFGSPPVAAFGAPAAPPNNPPFTFGSNPPPPAPPPPVFNPWPGHKPPAFGALPNPPPPQPHHPVFNPTNIRLANNRFPPPQNKPGAPPAPPPPHPPPPNAAAAGVAEAKEQPMPPVRYVEDTLVAALSFECMICMEDFQQGQLVVRLECLCVYHRTCADAWWTKSKSCPLHKRD